MGSGLNPVLQRSRYGFLLPMFVFVPQIHSQTPLRVVAAADLQPLLPSS